MTQGSSIPITAAVLEDLKADGEVKEGMYSPREDGRFDLHVSMKLRTQLDILVVRTGLDYSGVLESLRIIAESRKAEGAPG